MVNRGNRKNNDRTMGGDKKAAGSFQDRYSGNNQRPQPNHSQRSPNKKTMGTCIDGTHPMPDGSCMEGDTHPTRPRPQPIRPRHLPSQIGGDTTLTQQQQNCADDASLCSSSGQALMALCILSAGGYEPPEQSSGGCIDGLVSCFTMGTNIGVACEQSEGLITYIAPNEWTVGYSQQWESIFPNIPWDDVYDYSHTDNYNNNSVGCISNDDCSHNLECLNPIPLYVESENRFIIFGNSSCTSNDFSCVCGMDACATSSAGYWSLYEPAYHSVASSCMTVGTHNGFNGGYGSTGAYGDGNGFQNADSTSPQYALLVPDYKIFRNPRYGDIYSDFISCRNNICQKPATVGSYCEHNTQCYDNDYWEYHASECRDENPVGTGGESACKCVNVATGTTTNWFDSGNCGLLFVSGDPGAEEDCRQMCMNMNSCHIDGTGNCLEGYEYQSTIPSWQTEERFLDSWWYHAMYCHSSSNTCEVQDVFVDTDITW